MKLTVGNRNYSSWSLRAYLAVARTGADCVVAMTPLYMSGNADFGGGSVTASPSGLVPWLEDDGLVIWDSLAITEYLAERYPQAGLWPHDARERAEARSVCAEMHSGFAALRSSMGMDLRSRHPRPASPRLERDIDRVNAVWTSLRQRFAARGPFAFGAFSAVDCFYLPVAARFRTYGVHLSAAAGDTRARCWNGRRSWNGINLRRTNLTSSKAWTAKLRGGNHRAHDVLQNRI